MRKETMKLYSVKRKEFLSAMLPEAIFYRAEWLSYRHRDIQARAGMDNSEKKLKLGYEWKKERYQLNH